MPKRTYQQIREAILNTLSDGKSYTYAELERKLRTNPYTLRQHCTDLEAFSALNIIEKKNHEANGKPYFQIHITEEGLKAYNKLKLTRAK